jgi:hypothetical protein
LPFFQERKQHDEKSGSEKKKISKEVAKRSTTSASIEKVYSAF